MKIEEKDGCVMYFIENLLEFMEYKKLCIEKEKKLKEYQKAKPYEIDDTPFLIAAEDSLSAYNLVSRGSVITLDAALKYIKDLPIERIEEAKSIQLMLYELVGGICDKSDYIRISNALKKKSRPTTVVNVKKGGQNINYVKKQSNKYGR